MKKFLGIIVAFVAAVLLIGTASAIEKPKVTDHEKINIYVFRGNGCPHCQDAIAYLYGLNGEYDDYINVVTYEVWYNQENAAFAQAVAAKLNKQFSGVPFIVIGDQYKIGFGESTGEELIKMALTAYEDKDYEDLVANVIEENDLDSKSETLAKACEKEGIKTTSEGTKDESKVSDGLIVAAIIVIVAAGVAGLIYVSRK